MRAWLGSLLRKLADWINPPPKPPTIAQRLDATLHGFYDRGQEPIAAYLDFHQYRAFQACLDAATIFPIPHRPPEGGDPVLLYNGIQISTWTVLQEALISGDRRTVEYRDGFFIEVR